MEDVVSTILVLEVAAAFVLAFLNLREVRFLNRLRPHLQQDENLPLYEALSARAVQVSVIGVWLISITCAAALGVQLAQMFPPLRAINGALLLLLLSGPVILGRALRKKRAGDVQRAADRQVGEADSPSPSPSADGDQR